VLGSKARTEIARSEGRISGNALATAGIVLGSVAIALAVLGLMVLLSKPR